MNTVIKLPVGEHVNPVIKRVGTLIEDSKGYIVIEYTAELFEPLIVPAYSTDIESSPEGRMAAIVAGLNKEKKNGKKEK